MKSYYLLLVVITIIAIGITGCKSPQVLSDNIDDKEVEDSVFSARQDTVRVQSYADDALPGDPAAAELVEYYTVQIGAYEHPTNAEKVYRLAQQRFNLETNTEYDANDRLYKITVGKFINYEQARTFCDRIMREYSNEYSDAWVVEIAQRQRRQLQ